MFFFKITSSEIDWETYKTNNLIIIKNLVSNSCSKKEQNSGNISKLLGSNTWILMRYEHKSPIINFSFQIETFSFFFLQSQHIKQKLFLQWFMKNQCGFTNKRDYVELLHTFSRISYIKKSCYWFGEKKFEKKCLCAWIDKKKYG